MVGFCCAETAITPPPVTASCQVKENVLAALHTALNRIPKKWAGVKVCAGSGFCLVESADGQ